ncbi:MAG TPA: DUF3047 domain-containing protein [Noviherbaspirillum sp.]|jgi:hypothetical protein|uniref:DUF3047 domain-containing protein n=1 Tax=Noviherbaspirillum sp. TaxID=1926288 RepID=UPI002F93D7D6
MAAFFKPWRMRCLRLPSPFDDIMRLFALIPIAIAIAGCAAPPSIPPAAPGVTPESTLPSLFSLSTSDGLPPGWEPMVILRHKKQTQYQLVRKEERTVLHARADNASSGLMHRTLIDPIARPWLHWQWKIEDVLPDADNTRRATEDSPVRIILGFDGDKESLPFSDQILFETAKMVTGYDFPYATLMYIWENKAPVGTVIRSTHSGRIRMVVAAQGAEGVGKWHSFTRNIVEDFEKAYGEKPGKLIGIGVLTDTDNTGDSVEAWYGDIRILGNYE